MKLPLQITFRDMVPLPSVEPEIRRRADKLDQWTSDLMSCHVVVEAEGNRHRTGHQYRVRITLRVPDGDIVVGQHHLDEDIHRAVRSAFGAGLDAHQGPAHRIEVPQVGGQRTPGRRRHPGARIPAGRHRRTHDAGRRRPAAPGRA